ncbi:hypothetical protein BB561_000673 [Smittium simulii]|uniref:C2H2-type domain-containing protein n=1 Tax=Smittium simulii TaxID=133385 RepID=A0A2T9YY20_9FUNG|nr:hypothetical protein BB561_000673 [Smittium simulii]
MNAATKNRFVISPNIIPEVDSENQELPEEFTSFDTFPISLTCPFKHEDDLDNSDSSLHFFTDLKDLELHLLTDHGLLFSSLKHTVLFLEEYLLHYAQILSSDKADSTFQKVLIDDIEQLFSAKTIYSLLDIFAAIDSIPSTVDEIYLINPDTNPTDKKFREALQKKTLNRVLELQVSERREGFATSRICLFCTSYCSSIPELFSHMYKAHSFNIGLPDNLVYVEKFLNILENKLIGLQCIYCEKQFTSPIVLRKHMRKKKHFKISPRNHLYDQFYIVNYSEPDKDWKILENEKYESDDDKLDNSWDEWLDQESTAYISLFDSAKFETSELCLNYMTSKYKFDLAAIQKENNLDFYQFVTLINYIRSKSAQNKCYSCDLFLPDADGFAEHFHETSCSNQIPDKSSDVWSNPEYLKPALDNDALFSAIEFFTNDE